MQFFFKDNTKLWEKALCKFLRSTYMKNYAINAVVGINMEVWLAFTKSAHMRVSYIPTVRNVEFVIECFGELDGKAITFQQSLLDSLRAFDENDRRFCAGG